MNNGNLNTQRYYEMGEIIRKMRKQNLTKMQGGLLGRCPRCDTDGPCIESTCSSPGPDYDWEPGDTCHDRPFRDEETATAYLHDDYFSGSGGGMHRFWWHGEVRWIWKGLKYSGDEGAGNSSVFGLMYQIAAMMRDFRRVDGGDYHAEWAKKKLQEMLERM